MVVLVVVLREEALDWFVLELVVVSFFLELGEEDSVVFAAFLASFSFLGETQVTVGAI